MLKASDSLDELKECANTALNSEYGFNCKDGSKVRADWWQIFDTKTLSIVADGLGEKISEFTKIDNSYFERAVKESLT